MGSDARRWWALGGLVAAALTVGFDVTILNVALSTIANELSIGTRELQWIVNAYVIVLAGTMLSFGALADRYGRKRLMLIGLVMFAGASVAAAWADGAGVLIAARAVMGLGGAIILPVAFAVIHSLFDPPERARAVSLVVMGTALGLPLGPLLGGWLLDHFWWGSIFLVNLPVAAIAILILAIALPESRGSVQRRPDVAGGLLSTAGLVGVVYGLIEAPDRGWTDPLVASTVIAGIALLVAFAWWERRTANPMIDLRLFRNPLFLWGSTAGVLVSFGLLGMLFVVPQYLQLVAGYDAFGTGLRLLPLIGGLVIGAPLGERLTTRAGFKLPIAGGLLTLAVGLAAGTVTSTTSPYGMVAAWLTVVGFGTGMALSPAMNAVLAALPAEQSGAGTAITMTLRQVGGALGVALLGSILARSYANRLDVDAVPTAASSAAHDSLAGAIAVAERLNEPALAAAAQAAYIHGMRWVLVASAILAAASALLIASRLESRSGREIEADTPTATQVSE